MTRGYANLKVLLVAQISRELKRVFLQIMPEQMRMNLLDRHPNLRKSAPRKLTLQFDRYLGEFTVNIDTRFKVERIMWTGFYEPDLLELLRSWIEPGSVCLDLGANVGAITLAMAQRMKRSSGRVYAFEPAPETFVRLQANLALNPSVALHVIPVQLGVSDKPGVLHWAEEVGNEGNGGLLKGDGVEVEVTTVDRFCAERNIDRVDVVKIDVESMEYEVLCGAVETLRRDHPKLYFETMERSKGLRERNVFQKIEELLRGLDYELFKLDRRRKLVEAHAESFADYTIALVRAA